MTYEVEYIAAALKKARQNKGLSQRELAKLCGVPQSHISKIESNEVDLRISSLVSLSHALDLEIELIPRKAIPAVRSIAQHAMFQRPQGDGDALNEVHRILRTLNGLPKDLLENTATQKLEKHLKEMRNLRNIAGQTGELHLLRTALDGVVGVKELNRAASHAQRLRNMLVHNVGPVKPQESKPAYGLDDEADDDV